MLSVGRILRDYTDAGSLNALLAPWGFVDEGTFITKSGHLGHVYELQGPDYECLEPTRRREIVHRFEAALRVFDERFRIYQYLSKRRIAPLQAASCVHPIVNDAVQRHVQFVNDRRLNLYDMNVFLVVLYEGGTSRIGVRSFGRSFARAAFDALRIRTSTAATLTILQQDIERALLELNQRARAFEIQLGGTAQPRRLLKREAFRFLYSLVNYAPEKRDGAVLHHDTHLDYFLSDSAVECHRDRLDVDSHAVKVLAMKDPPASTVAHALEGLYTVSGEFIACLEWRRIPNERARRDLQMRRRHFFNKRISLVNYVAPDTRADEMLVDESATATVRQLGDALTELEVNGHYFGECSLTIVAFDDDTARLTRAVGEAAKALAVQDGVFIEESYNLLNAWLSIMPGNSAHNVRRLALLDTNCADLSFLFTLDCGTAADAQSRREALAVFETRHQTPYYFDLHVDDVAHALVLGATGSGKSFLLNFLITQAQKYQPLTTVFDLGHSYRKLAALLEGSFLELRLGQTDVTINPFAFSPTPEHLHFLHAFSRVLLEGADAYRLSEAEDRELYEAIENVYVLDRGQRRLFTLANLLPRDLSRRLGRWIEGGRYGAMFDNVDDTLSLQPFQVFEFEAMQSYPELLEPLLFYVLHRTTSVVQSPTESPRLKLCVMDEAWRFIQHERLRDYVHEALKTWRKRNAAMLLATQSVEDFASAELLRTVVENCPTKLLLANPAFDRERYRELLQLNDTELHLFAELTPRRQMLLKRPTVAKVLALAVDPRSYWLYTNTPADNERMRALVDRHGFGVALDHLTNSL